MSREVPAVIDLPAIFIANGIGVVLMIILLISNHLNARNVFFDEKLFFHMVVLSLLLCTAEAVSFCLDGQTFPGARVLYLLLNCTLFLLGMAFTFLWTIYVDYKLFEDRRRLSKRYPVLALPVVVVSLLILANLFTPVFFTLSQDNVYSRTPMSALLYVVVGGYLAYTVALVYRSRRKVKRYLFLPVLIFLTPILLGIMLQMAFYGMSFIWVSVSVGLVSLYINIQNEASWVDSLTGLYNRQYLSRFLLSNPERQPSGQLLGGILLDVDAFKEINDTYGHMCGDAALRDVGGLLHSLPLPGALPPATPETSSSWFSWWTARRRSPPWPRSCGSGRRRSTAPTAGPIICPSPWGAASGAPARIWTPSSDTWTSGCTPKNGPNPCPGSRLRTGRFSPPGGQLSLLCVFRVPMHPSRGTSYPCGGCFRPFWAFLYFFGTFCVF